MSGFVGDLSAEQAATLAWLKEEGRHAYATEPQFRAVASRYFFKEMARDEDLLRFCRARKWDRPAIRDQLFQMMKWRHEFGVYNITEESINPAVLAAGLSYFNARPDAAGRPVTIIHVANNHKRGYNTEDLNRYTIFSMEFGRKLLPPGIDRVTILFDMTNFGPSNMDLGFVRFFVTALERYYPETLSFVLIYNAPWVFQPFWRIITPWLDPVVSEKIVFIGAAEELYARIPRANLPKCFGGDLENVVHPILPSQYYPLHFPKLRDLPVEALKTTVLPEFLVDSASETDLRSGTLSPAPAGEEAADNVAVPRAARSSNGNVPTASDAGAFLQEPEIEPPRLVAIRKGSARPTATVQITNRNSVPITFKIKVTNLKLFRASPSIGKIDANGTVVVTIWIVGEPTREDARKHAFMIQAKAIRPDAALDADPKTFWGGDGDSTEPFRRTLLCAVLEPDEPVPTFVERPAVTRTYSQDPRAELSDGGRSGAASAVASSPANADAGSKSSTKLSPTPAVREREPSIDPAILALGRALDALNVEAMEPPVKQVLVALRAYHGALVQSGAAAQFGPDLAGPAGTLQRAVGVLTTGVREPPVVRVPIFLGAVLAALLAAYLIGTYVSRST